MLVRLSRDEVFTQRTTLRVVHRLPSQSQQHNNEGGVLNALCESRLLAKVSSRVARDNLQVCLCALHCLRCVAFDLASYESTHALANLARTAIGGCSLVLPVTSVDVSIRQPVLLLAKDVHHSMHVLMCRRLIAHLDDT
eukprot:754526-Prymnesium_polylepis.1